MSDRVEIEGGAGPYETAAIAAAVRIMLEEEAADSGQPPPAFVPGPWILAGRPHALQAIRGGFRELSALLSEQEEEPPEEA
jgi:hypothetical protein